MFIVTQYIVDAYSEMINTQIVLCGNCGLVWKSGHVCLGNCSFVTTADPFCCVCGFYHNGACCMGAKGETGWTTTD